MIWYTLSVGFLWCVAGTLTWMSFRHEALQDSLRFHLVGAAAFIGGVIGSLVATFALGSSGGGWGGIISSILVYLPAPMLGVFLGAPFLARTFVLLLESATRAFFSEGRLVVTPTYDRGEALEKRHRWEDALAFYRAAIENDADDREARRRIAEIEVRRGQTDRAIREFEVLVASASGPEESIGPLLRTVDLLTEARRLNRARKILRDFLDRCDDPERAHLARRRLEKLEG